MIWRLALAVLLRAIPILIVVYAIINGEVSGEHPTIAKKHFHAWFMALSGPLLLLGRSFPPESCGGYVPCDRSA